MIRFWIGALAVVVAGSVATAKQARAADPAEVHDLVRIIGDLSLDVARRNAAIKEVLEMKEKAAPAIPDIVKLTKSENPNARMIAVALLASIGPASKVTIDEILPRLKDEDVHVRYWTCKAFGAMGAEAKRVVPNLIELLQKDAASVRRHAALAIGGIGPAAGADAVPPLVKALADPVQPVRADAVTALGQLGEVAKSAVPDIEQALERPRFNANTAAAVAHWRITGRADLAIKYLLDEIQKLDNPWEAAAGFETLGAAAKDAVPALTRMLDAEDPETKLYAIEALAGIGPPAASAADKIAKFAQDDQPDEDLRETSRAALKKLKP